MEREKRLSRVQMEYLVQWIRMSEKNRSLGALGNMRGVSRSAVQKMLAVSVKAGFLDQKYRATEAGMAQVFWYRSRYDAIVRWFLQNNLSQEDAEAAADVLMSGAPLQVIEMMFNKSLICSICKRSSFEREGEIGVTGTALSQVLPQGVYQIGVEFRKIKDEGELSMANAAFEKPGKLLIGENHSEVQLKRVRISHTSGYSHLAVSGKMRTMEYEAGGRTRKLKIEDECVLIPVDDILWSCEGKDGVLTGKLRVEFTCTAGPLHMPKAAAIMYVRIICMEENAV